MENIINLVEFAAVAAIGAIYTSSRFQEKLLELKLFLDKELAPLCKRQSELEGELRRLDAIIQSEDIINNVSDQGNSTLLTVMIAMWILQKDYHD